jgi:NADH-quinone oxidoreductase subunit F
MSSDHTLRVAVGDATGGAAALSAARGTAASVRAVGPTGADALEPVALATVDGRTALHATVDAETAERLGEAVANGRLPEDRAVGVADHDPAEPPAFDHPALATGTRRALARCGWVDPTDPSLVGALPTHGETFAAIRDAGLRPRGRGDGATIDAETVAETWRLAREATGDAVVVVNGAESDERVAGDRRLLESDPALVLDAALAASGYVGAGEVVVLLPETASTARDRVTALAAGLDAEVEVVTAPETFRVAEPTMALESMEGADRIEARRRPPGPAEYGLFGRPTVVHTPRTLAQVALLAREGPTGAPTDPGTRLLTVTDGDDRATVELPTDGRLRDALAAVGDPEYRFATVGGQFGGLSRTLDVPANADAMAGARLGTEGAIELHGEGACAVALAGRRAKAAREGNCGRCVPCREGSKQLHELLRGVYDGSFEEGAITELGRTVRDTSLCSFGTAAARPVLTAVAEFAPEFRAHADGRCPAGECR